MAGTAVVGDRDGHRSGGGVEAPLQDGVGGDRTREGDQTSQADAGDMSFHGLMVLSIVSGFFSCEGH